MKPYITLSFALLLMLAVSAQAKKKVRTVTAPFLKHGNVLGDTTFFYYSGPTGNDLMRFFQRNMRVRLEDGEQQFGYCTLYFMIDTTGEITKAWCDSVTNEWVEKEMLRVVNKLARLKPTVIKGKPVITKVKTTVAMLHADDPAVKTTKVDLLVYASDPRHKKAMVGSVRHAKE